jgi:hypothetical protein
LEEGIISIGVLATPRNRFRTRIRREISEYILVTTRIKIEMSDGPYGCFIIPGEG